MNSILHPFSARLAICFLLCPVGLRAQTTEKPLSNEDIVNMLKGELPESAIVLAIELASRRGATQFDTTPSALIESRNQGATGRALEAILLARQAEPAPPRPRKQPQISAIPGLPSSSGVYYQSAQGWIALRATLLWPQQRGIWPLPIQLRYQERVIRLADFWAPLQVSERRPTFYVRGSYAGQKWKLLRLTQKRDQRELRVWIEPLFAPPIRFRPTDLREVEFTEVEPDVVILHPNLEFEPGEYLLVAPLRGQRRIFVGYDFGVAK